MTLWGSTRPPDPGGATRPAEPFVLDAAVCPSVPSAAPGPPGYRPARPAEPVSGPCRTCQIRIAVEGLARIGCSACRSRPCDLERGRSGAICTLEIRCKTGERCGRARQVRRRVPAKKTAPAPAAAPAEGWLMTIERRASHYARPR